MVRFRWYGIARKTEDVRSRVKLLMTGCQYVTPTGVAAERMENCALLDATV